MKSLSAVSTLLLVPLALSATPAEAAPFTDPAAIDAAVAQFTGVPQGATGGAAQPVDRRLRLATCRNPLSIGWYGQRRDTVLVQCPDVGSWRLFVPLLQTVGAASTPAVLRGESVTVAVSGPGFSISQPGEALDGGAVGTWIRVRSAVAGSQPMRARIVRPGLVEVQLEGD
ncbi:flagella basal body P-ring formation protein FlgA [Novosphingobium piscinae]|uniref:Flagella basal body P-ring formation protein FlgA n=1 Tax=Novosphingobium piscinae TaxID=1507448 RepID=A0A7X1KR85_9SPHN|nr:flagella basal body P-ring formation protein FlgA [Novosphingobium piscinae]MBC2670452.1 flagella basal body P-ring formation protein FlgA [Novosphingobium piscinae]